MMTAPLASLALLLAFGSTGLFDHAPGTNPGLYHHRPRPRFLGPGPGDGWGFPNGAPDHYGWYDPGYLLPLWADRTPEYYFRRHFSLPANQMVFPNYYNTYVTRGQRYIPYSGCGGFHPAGGPPAASAHLPIRPTRESDQTIPIVPVPTYSGRVEAAPVNSGSTGLTP